MAVLFCGTQKLENHKAPSLHCFMVEYGIKWAGKANLWHKMAKNDILGLNLADLDPEFCLLGEGKNFGTSISRTNA